MLAAGCAGTDGDTARSDGGSSANAVVPAASASTTAARPAASSAPQRTADRTTPRTTPRAEPRRACRSGPRRTADGTRRFWTKDRRCYTSRWYAGAHRRMIPFGCTRAPWYPPSSRCARGRGFHHGLDLAMRKGTKVYAGVRGRIVTRGLGSAYGSRAVIIRSRGRDVLLGHLRSRRVSHGDRVRRGDLVGRSGARGAPDGPHLHVEVRPARGSYLSAVSPRRVLRLRVAG
ncbi:peptidase M23-like protein [Mumia flava]|uniref:Peptidase M23-like protein n=1 Tax=Mumia flava TaxID=1348852 RepID=A0A0B2BVU7_9ACTN|nr:peptidase M23-like protein [Mumia flava]